MIRRILISIFVWVVGAMLTIALYFVMLFVAILSPFDKTRRATHAQCFWWARGVVTLNPYWHVSVSGLENIDKNKTYVIVVNHQSLADIVVVYLTHLQFKWVAKESLFRVPFVGWSLSLAKHIKLARGDFGSIKQIYRDAAVWLKKGMSVLFFPEGTRSSDGVMKEFQNGAFKLAIKEKVSILPIAIRGTGDVIPRGTWLFNAMKPTSIKVLPAIDVSGFSSADFARLRDMARLAIAKA